MVACRRCDALDFFNEKRGKRASPVERGGWRGGPFGGGGTREDAGGCRGPIDGRRDPLTPRCRYTALDRINSLLIDNQSIIDRLSIGD